MRETNLDGRTGEFLAEADDAYSRRDWPRVVALLEPIRHALAPEHRKKLDIARRSLNPGACGCDRRG